MRKIPENQSSGQLSKATAVLSSQAAKILIEESVEPTLDYAGVDRDSMHWHGGKRWLLHMNKVCTG